MESPINWRLVGHPLNWVTVFLMVFIAGLAIHFVCSYFKVIQSPATASGTSASVSV